MQTIHKKELYKTLLITGMINAVLNGVIAWLIVKKTGVIPLMGIPESVAFDFIMTGIFLGFLLAFLSAGSKIKKARKIGLPGLQGVELGIAGRLPDSHFRSALIMGLIGLCFALVVTGVFLLMGLDKLDLYSFVVIKIIYAVFLASMVDYLTTMRCWNQQLIFAA